MSEPFELATDIVIDAPPAAVLDYVSNPQSWREWMPATHEIDCPNRPLLAANIKRNVETAVHG